MNPGGISSFAKNTKKENYFFVVGRKNYDN
jgi:hypothetical protein